MKRSRRVLAVAFLLGSLLLVTDCHNPASYGGPASSAPSAPPTPTLTLGNQQISVDWTAVSGATSYNVYYNTTDNSSLASQWGGDYTGTTATIDGLTNGTLYYVWVKAKNAGGSSPFSPAASGAPVPSAPSAPPAPTLTLGNQQISVDWTAVSGATSYNVYYNTTNDPNTAIQWGGDYTATTATISGLTNGTLYYVWVRAKNAGGSSPFSPAASATPGLPYVALGGGSVAVSQFNGKYIYTIVSPEPASKPEGSGTPPSTYSYTISTVVGSMAAPMTKELPFLIGAPGRAKALHFGTQQMETDLRMRKAEQEALSSRALQLSKKPSGIDAAAPSPIVVGTTWNGVYIVATGASISTTCSYVSGNAYFFVDNRDITAMESSLSSYGAAFDAIYAVNHTKFGTENDTDNNGKVIVVFSRELTGGLLGYFWAVDKYPKTTYSQSNEGDIFYITTDTAYQGSVVDGTLAHEFQHMIYFDQHNNRGVTSTYTWLNEALSQAAEFYNNYTDNHEAWIWSFLDSDWSTGLSLTYWTSLNYGYGAIFIRYLIDQFGDTAIKNMCSTDKVGITAVEAATGTDFNLIFNNFTRALVMSGTGDSVDPTYNFSTLNLQSVQPSGRGGLLIATSFSAGSMASGNLSPYSLAAAAWTGTLGTMDLSGTNLGGSAFGLKR